MSVTPAQLEAYAAAVLNNPAMEEVRNRVKLSLFDRFRTANHAEREIINAIMDNETLFYDELKNILDGAEVVNETEAEEESIND